LKDTSQDQYGTIFVANVQSDPETYIHFS